MTAEAFGAELMDMFDTCIDDESIQVFEQTLLQMLTPVEAEPMAEA